MLTLGSGKIYVASWRSGANPENPAGVYTGTYVPTLIGEIGGDVEFNMGLQEAEFRGQHNFPIAKAFFGGNLTVGARGVELDFDNLERFWAETSTSTGGNDVYTVDYDTQPYPLYVKMVHNRTDVIGETVTIHVWKAYAPTLNFPFMREDISQTDIDFVAISDSTLTGAANQIIRVEVSQQ
jgi:hypothetical protein